jgi:general secretion pathway protein M
MNYLNLLVEYYREMDQRDRLRWGIGIAAVLLLAICYSALNGRIALLTRKRAARESDVAEMLVLKQRYQEANAVAQKLANRMAALQPDDSPARIIEETGIKGKTSQSKALKSEDRGSYLEDTAEVKIEGLTANETVNLLYKLEKGNKPVVIKKALLKTRFDDPSKLDVTMTIALLKPSAQGRK